MKSGGFQEIIRYLESKHPMRKRLDHNASQECRALWQIQIQEYEDVLYMLRGMAVNAPLKEVESTYEEK